MKYINRTLLLIIATVFFSGLLVGLFPQRTEAALKMEDDYIIYRSYTLIWDCLTKEDSGDKDPEPKKSGKQDTLNSTFQDTEKVQSGKLYAKLAKTGDEVFDCNTAKFIDKALEILGFEGVFDFAEKITNKSDDQIRNLLRDQVKAQGGRLDLTNDPAFQYWFWDRVYRSSKDGGGCEGVLGDKYKDSKENNSEGTFYNVGEDGVAKPYKVASYNVASGHEVESIDGSMTGEKKWTCFEIAKMLTKDRADAYGAQLKINLADGDPSNDYTTTTTAEMIDGINAADSCESTGGVLSWVMCPVVEMLGGALNWVDTQVSRLLEVDAGKVGNDQLYQVWANFRNIGLILLIIAMLIMVISTALGLNFLDAYTVKKAMPRMVAAIVFMLLSWWICLFMITVTNAIGQGVLGIMTAPFEGKVDSMSSMFTPDAGGAVTQWATIFVGVGVIAAVPGALGILMSWFGAALLIVGIALLVLVARQMFIITLILFAPLAILTWIFPGNDKGWKFWWTSFTKLLIMYPLIMALIASGRIFAGVISFTASDSEGAESLIRPLIQLTAYVVPYVFIPFTFKFAGGVFGNLAGMVNDRSKGAFDRLRKGRQKTYGEIGRNMKGGVGFRGNQKNILNRASSGLAAGYKGWIPGETGRMQRQGSRNTAAIIAGQAQLEGSNTHKVMKNNDAYLLAMASEELALEKIQESKDKLELAKRFGDVGAQRAAQADVDNRESALAAARTINNKTNATRRQAALELAATGYQFSEGAAGYEELRRIGQAVSGGDAGAYAEFMDNAQYNLKAAQRFDLGGINHGAGYDPKSSTDKASLYQLANAKSESIGAMVESGGGIPAAGASLDAEQQVQAMTTYKELKAMLPNATGAARDKIYDSIMKFEDSGHVTDAVGAVASGRIDASTGGPIMVQSQRSVDYDPAQAAIDLANGRGWTNDEVAKGSRVESYMRPETLGDIAEARARTYERPDPNKMDI
jgi:MFS family permease